MVWRSNKIIEVCQYFVIELVLDQIYTCGSLFFVSIKEKTLQRFSLHTENAMICDLVLILFIFVVHHSAVDLIKKYNEQLKIQIYSRV